MKYKVIIKRRFRKPKTITMCGEDEYWARNNIHREYPKHKILNLKLAY